MSQYLDKKNLQISNGIESFKNKIYDILENDLQCPICNEVIVKVNTIYSMSMT